MAPADRPKRLNGLAIEEDGAFYVVREPRRVHVFNASGATIFGLCDGTRTVGRIAGIIGEIFALDREPLDDVEACLCDMQQRGLITVLPGGSEPPA